MTTSPNGTRLTVIISVAIGLVTVLVSIGSIIYTVGGYSTKIGQHEAHLAEVLPLVDSLENKLSIAETKISDTEKSIAKLFVTQNMMRKEIQLNAEGKLNRDDFFRLHKAQEARENARFKALDARVLYLQRHQLDLEVHEEVHKP